MAKNSDRVKELIEQVLMPDGEMQDSSRLVEDLGADSLDQVELVMTLEDEFGIEVPDRDAEKLVTVKNVVDYVEKHT